MTLGQLTLASLFIAGTAAADIPKLNLDTTHISVSGLSSGGYMANQFHIAHSAWVTGAGIISAGPYYCAKGDIFTALGQCVNKMETPVDLAALNAQLKDWEKQGKVDGLINLKHDKVWLLHGTKDTRVIQAVTDKLAEQYRQLMPTENLQYSSNKPFAHHFPTKDKGSKCDVSEAPFIGNCDYNAASDMLDFIASSPEADNQNGKLYEFNQHQLGGDAAISLADTGYVFIPQNCEQGAQCKVHVSFHGCNQNAEAVGDAYTTKTGINQWAATHNTVVLYPQTKKSTVMPLNPQACWDWWGYTDANYATKDGQQIKAVSNMVHALEAK
ncbi:PHB depolymerase family esterase [Neptunicella marina]|uniref:Polyhydroxybutyrate depolymerase n=1 Tax=Neptunicella marina TaxID=2125989 RepID=A0A8J6IRX0_9ALTE|nr:PHB depolymerase family esterase [Neptunicella marina]MBC3764655.1 polyhydroxybutyrate depolymerase [Neptunicella marina]